MSVRPWPAQNWLGILAEPAGPARRRGGPLATVIAGVIVSVSASACVGPAPGPTTTSSTRQVPSTAPGARVLPPSQRLALPAVDGTTLAGGRLSLRELAAHGPLVVNVWASWCSSCRTESAVLARAWRTTRGVTFIGIDEQDTDGAGRAYAAHVHTGYAQLRDPDGTILARLSLLPSFGIPSTLVVDRQARMAARVVGPVTLPELRTVIARVRAGT